jgi:hypothetical protein
MQKPRGVRIGRTDTIGAPREPNPDLDPANPDSRVPPLSDTGSLPDFKYPFSLANKRVYQGGWSREVTVRELPVAKELAGVNMRLVAGGIGELQHQLGPHLRRLPSEKLVLADGFSCKTQIEKATGRHPLHLAQVLQRVKHGGPALDHRTDGFERGGSDQSALVKTSIGVLGGVVLGLAALYLVRRMFR